MMGIVFEHCSVLWTDQYVNYGDKVIQASVMQFFKFATIAFFLIGGFLINHKFTEYTPLAYLKNRFKNTIGPWAFWIAVLIGLNVIQRYVVFSKNNDISTLPNWNYISGQLYQIVFYTSFWFILNFLICISLLLIFKRYLYKLWFGVILGVVSLFYSVNLYYEWVTTEHSTALFGFVFYLWLGVYMNRHYDKVSIFIAKLSWSWLIVVNVLFFIAADAEILHLMQRGSTDAFNTLRISNVFYSLSMFALLLKIGSIAVLQKRLKPRQTTFGVYLLHEILILRLLSEIFRPGKFNIAQMNIFEATGYTLLRFLIIYGISFFLVNLILKSKFKWTIGVKELPKTPKPSLPV